MHHLFWTGGFLFCIAFFGQVGLFRVAFCGQVSLSSTLPSLDRWVSSAASVLFGSVQLQPQILVRDRKSYKLVTLHNSVSVTSHKFKPIKSVRTADKIVVKHGKNATNSLDLFLSLSPPPSSLSLPLSLSSSLSLPLSIPFSLCLLYTSHHCKGLQSMRTIAHKMWQKHMN